MQSPIGLSLISFHFLSKRACEAIVKPLFNTSIKILISPLPMLYLQKVLSIHLKKCVLYIQIAFVKVCLSHLRAHDNHVIATRAQKPPCRHVGFRRLDPSRSARIKKQLAK